MSQAWKTAGLVLLLSALVWVSAERAVTATKRDVRAELRLDTPPPDVRVRFLNEQDQPIEDRTLSVRLEVVGPQSRIRRLEEREMEPPVIRITLESLGYTRNDNAEPQVFTPRVVDLLDGELRLGEEGDFLAVTSAEPEVVRIRVTPLVRAELEVKVFDPRGQELPVQELNPRTVEAYIEPTVTGAARIARVTLSQDQQTRASLAAIQVPAALPSGSEPRETNVQVRLPITPGATETIEQPRIGVSKPAHMEGKYDVLIEDLDAKLDAYAPIEIQGPERARQEFREAPYHLLLEIRTEDLAQDSPARQLQYNLGDLAGELKILNPRSEAVRFRLVPNLAPIESPAPIVTP